MLFLEIILIITQQTLGWIVKNTVPLAGELHDDDVQKVLIFSNLQFPYFAL